MIKRELSFYIEKAAKCYGVVTIMGPRQSGKTTLVKALSLSMNIAILRQKMC